MASNSSSSTQVHYADDPARFPLQGGCSCGLIRYSLDLAPLCVHDCYCTACARENGSTHAVNAMIESAHFHLLPPDHTPSVPYSASDDTSKPAPRVSPILADPSTLSPAQTPDTEGIYQPFWVETPSQSGLPQSIARCPRCFVAVFSHYIMGGPYLKFIKVGTLDKPYLIEPDVHIWNRSRRHWQGDFRDGKPVFEQFYDRNETWRPEALERWNDILPEIMKWREPALKKFKEDLANREAGEEEN